MVANAGKSEVGAGATVSGLTHECAHPSKSYYCCCCRCCRYLHLVSHLNATYLLSIYYLFTILITIPISYPQKLTERGICAF